jgi:3-phenylpropionate/trans-cinnamate dioxygenase ferredoxin reductase component
MSRRPRIVVVGASIGGVSTVEALRAEGFDGEIVVLGAEPHAPYSRPPLSKQALLADVEPAAAALLDERGFRALEAELMLGTAATRLDVARRTIHTERGALAFDTAVLATGARARRLPDDDVLALRTLDDAARLRSALHDAARVAIIGAGVLGSEVASAARRLGRETVLISRGTGLRLGGVGGILGRRLETAHRDAGVDLRLGVPVGEVGAHRVTLVDDTVVDADVVVEAIGAVPATDWLTGSGLSLVGGIRCDRAGRAAHGVYAVGDVAAWPDAVTGAPRRIEHQLAAIQQAQAVARHLVRGEISPPVIPFFWTEVHGSWVQVAGRLDAAPLDVVDGDVALGPFVAAATAAGEVTGVVGWDSPRTFTRVRRQLHTAVAA